MNSVFIVSSPDVSFASEYVLQRSGRPRHPPYPCCPVCFDHVCVCVLCSGMDTWSAYNFEVTSFKLCFLQTVFSKPLFAGDGQSFDGKRDFPLRTICLCAETRTKIRAVVVEEPFPCKWLALDMACYCCKVAFIWWLFSVMWSCSL